VFARRIDGDLASFVRALDKTLEQHAARKARGAVIVLTKKPDDVRPALERLATDAGLERVPLCTSRPEDAERGPGSFELDPKAAFTIVAYDGDKKIRSWLVHESLDERARAHALDEINRTFAAR
jgi:hypothetical protein